MNKKIRGFGQSFKRCYTFFTLRLFRLNEGTGRIARGVAVGLWVAFTPTIGIQMIVAVAVALIFRASKVAAILMCWITNPVTAIPIFGFNFYLGRLLYPKEVVFKAHYLASWENFFAAGWDFVIILWLGSIIVASVLAVLGYVFTLKYYETLKDRVLQLTLDRIKERRRKKRRETETKTN